jgi:hypothetical protein
LNTLGPKMGYDCRETIKHVAFSSRPATVISKLAEKL